MFSWRSWLFAWYVRILAQVMFFGLIGRFLDEPDLVRFLVIGNVCLVAAAAGVTAIAGASTDVRAGTLPLLVAAPVPPAAAFAGRGFYVVADAVATACGALFVVAPIFGVTLSPATAVLVVPLAAAIAVSAYALGVFLTAVVIHLPNARNLSLNLTIAILATICGVNFAVADLPGPLPQIAHVVPLTNGLASVRALFASAEPAAIAGWAAAELAVAAGWLAAALVAFTLVTARGRRRGAIDFG